MIRNATIFTNPKAGAGRAGRLEEHVRSLLREAGLNVRHQELTPPASAVGGGPAPAVPDPTELAVVVGGDGTLNAVVNAIDRARVPVLLVPAGTSNSVARDLGLAGDPQRILRTLWDGHERKVDAIEVEWEGSGTPPRLSLLCASVGFDAEVVHALSRKRSGPISYLSYAMPFASTLAGFAYKDLRVEVDGTTMVTDATTVIVCNTRIYGGTMVVADAARPDDGWLDICALSVHGRVRMLCCLAAATLRGLGKLRCVRMLRGRQCRITPTTDWGAAVQADGEAMPLLAGKPLKLTCRPGAVRFLVPGAEAK